MALQGTIDSFPLTDVLSLLGSSSKTGVLSLSGDRGTGCLWVDDGAIVGGEVGDRVAADVSRLVFELLRFADGDFEFTALGADEIPHTDQPASSVSECISRAEELLEQWATIEAVVASMGHRVSLVPELPRAELTLDAFSWSLIVAAGVTPTVQQMADELDLDEFEACAAVASLVEEGLAEVLEPVAANETEPDEVEGAWPADLSVLDDRDHDVREAVASADTGADESDGARTRGFPERFPIDDLLGDGDMDHEDPWASPEMEQLKAQRRSDAESFDELTFRAMPPLEPVPLSDASAEQPVDADEFRSTAEAWDEMVADEEPSPVQGAERTEEDTTDEVLRQMSKLSPKAAEAIAAALSSVPSTPSAGVDERDGDDGTDAPGSFLGSF